MGILISNIKKQFLIFLDEQKVREKFFRAIISQEKTGRTRTLDELFELIEKEPDYSVAEDHIRNITYRCFNTGISKEGSGFWVDIICKWRDFLDAYIDEYEHATNRYLRMGMKIENKIITKDNNGKKL